MHGHGVFHATQVEFQMKILNVVRFYMKLLNGSEDTSIATNILKSILNSINFQIIGDTSFVHFNYLRSTNRTFR